MSKKREGKSPMMFWIEDALKAKVEKACKTLGISKSAFFRLLVSGAIKVDKDGVKISNN